MLLSISTTTNILHLWIILGEALQVPTSEVLEMGDVVRVKRQKTTPSAPPPTPPKYSSNSTLIKKLEKSKESFVEALLLCLQPSQAFHYCKRSHGGRPCFLSCLLDPFPWIRGLPHLLPLLPLPLCYPIHTEFDQVTASIWEGSVRPRSAKEFAALFRRGGSEGAAHLPYLLIRYGALNNPLLKPLKGLLSEIRRTLEQMNWKNHKLHKHSQRSRMDRNEACDQVDFWEEGVGALERFIEYPPAGDILLPGWFTLSSLYAAGGVLDGGLGGEILGLRLLIRILAGVECSLVSWGGGGDAANCSQVLGPSLREQPRERSGRLYRGSNSSEGFDEELLCGGVRDLGMIDLTKILVDRVDNLVIRPPPPVPQNE